MGKSALFSERSAMWIRVHQHALQYGQMEEELLLVP